LMERKGNKPKKMLIWPTTWPCRCCQLLHSSPTLEITSGLTWTFTLFCKFGMYRHICLTFSCITYGIKNLILFLKVIDDVTTAIWECKTGHVARGQLDMYVPHSCDDSKLQELDQQWNTESLELQRHQKEPHKLGLKV
jgi:hypothetical protein